MHKGTLNRMKKTSFIFYFV